MSDDDHEGLSRRTLFQAGIGVGLGVAGLSMLSGVESLRPVVAESPTTAPPAVGDLLVAARADTKDRVLVVDDVPIGAAPMLAWPMDPRLRVTKSASHDNLVLLVRAEQASWFSDRMAQFTAGGIVAYSAICTHLCCTVAEWRQTDSGHGFLLCPCHRSEFDPWNGARVLGGPAPRPLPLLPLRLAGSRLEVAGGFSAPLGCTAG